MSVCSCQQQTQTTDRISRLVQHILTQQKYVLPSLLLSLLTILEADLNWSCCCNWFISHSCSLSTSQRQFMAGLCSRQICVCLLWYRQHVTELEWSADTDNSGIHHLTCSSFERFDRGLHYSNPASLWWMQVWQALAADGIPHMIITCLANCEDSRAVGCVCPCHLLVSYQCLIQVNCWLVEWYIGWLHFLAEPFGWDKTLTWVQLNFGLSPDRRLAQQNCY